MPTLPVQLHPPRDEQVFEDLCLDLFSALWDGAQLYGRRGHEQKGIDIYGTLDGEHVAVQCKKREGKLTKADVRKDVVSARAHEPPFAKLIFATTAKRDTKLQDFARDLKESFEVEINFWDDLEREIQLHEEVFRRWQHALSCSAPLVAVDRLPHSILPELIGREKELATLNEAWSDPSTRAISVVAVGGAGKTALVHHWMQSFEDAGWQAKGAAAALAWSFYSQGAGEDRQASGDLFIAEALKFFGDRDPTEGSPRDRGLRLAGHIRRRRTLLILDGLEPLQEPPSSAQAGKVKDPAVAALIEQLVSDNPGLLVVTTREPVRELESRKGKGARSLDLETLSDEAGAALLRWLEVKGRDEELQAVAKEVHGHALTLTLLGTFLRDAHDGDVRAWKDLSLLEVDDLIDNVQASRVMESYSSWFGPGPESQILAVVGLFDRPAAAGLVDALRQEPAIPGVTDELVALSPVRWKLALSKLRKARLLLEAEDNATLNQQDLDAHPLVREHFGRRLQQQNPAAWKEAHSRLFDHLKDNTEHQPETLEGLQPLYQAVVHGCHAGRQQEACDEVYLARILRGADHYTWHKLGAFGAEVGAQACFFESPWSRVSHSLTEAHRAWLVNEAAFCLRALGRLTEAIEPLRAAVASVAEAKSWRDAARGASNLSELELTLGDVSAAVRDAEQSVDFADRSGDAFLKMGFRATLADALHQAGRRDEARERFREAEAMQADRQPQYPLLYSLAGFRYCDLLLNDAERAAAGGRRAGGVLGECGDVERRALKMFEWRVPLDPILDIALDHLTLGRARLYRAILEGSSLDDAKPAIEQAVEGLRAARQNDELPKGLLTRAWLRSAQGDAEGARADLAEAQEIAERGPMPLFLADVHLYRARFFHDRDALAEARRLVNKHGYGRRLGELEDLEAVSSSWPSSSADLGSP